MSQDMVTRDELARSLQELETRIEGRRQAFEQRLEAQVGKFMGEVNGHIVRITQEAHNGRRELIESNQALVVAWNRAGDRADQAAAAENRHRESTARRLASLEDALDTLKKGFAELRDDMLESMRLIRNEIQGGRP